jgi:hypothetical protein
MAPDIILMAGSLNTAEFGMILMRSGNFFLAIG